MSSLVKQENYRFIVFDGIARRLQLITIMRESTCSKMLKRKIKVISLSDKLKIVNEFEGGKSRNAILSKFVLAESTFYKIIRNKDVIKQQCAEGHGKIKRNKSVEFPEVENCLVEWIKQTLDKNIPIDGTLLKEKSKMFALKLGIHNFSASNGWLEGFKRRHDVSFKKAAGESKSVDQGVCNQWTEDLPNLLTEYHPNDIYNADETALFFKCLPDKTFTFKGRECHGAKQSKERLTILQCTNMTGTDKLPLLIIGKSKQPRCFKGVKTLPVEYDSNAKAWMTRIIFKGWLKKLDKKMKSNGKKIILFVDNCSAHTDLPALTNVKIMFLPANTTSKLQPLDQGIIHTFKRLYRREVVNHIISCLDENISPVINVLLAMKFARKAWYTVNNATIKNCFKKAGFRSASECQDVVILEENDVQEPSVEEWDKLVGCETSTNRPTFDEYVGIDDDLPTAGEHTDEDIVADCSSAFRQNEDGDEDDQTFGEIDVEKKPILKTDALNAIETLHSYFEHCDTDPSIFDKIYELEKQVKKCNNGTQKKLTDFFK